ncbi:MAG: Eco57I restriction-modification methylase domain-containing protein [Candidatus Hodarchaeota archaeon]
MWRTRPDSISVWKNPEVVKKLNKYYQLTRKEKVARYLLSKGLSVKIDLNEDLPTLWQEHERLKFEEAFLQPENNKGFHLVIANPPYGAKFLEFDKKLLKKLSGRFNQSNIGSILS